MDSTIVSSERPAPSHWARALDDHKKKLAERAAHLARVRALRARKAALEAAAGVVALEDAGVGLRLEDSRITAVEWALPHHGPGPSLPGCGQWMTIGHFEGGTVHARSLVRDCVTFDCTVCRTGWDEALGKWGKARGWEARAAARAAQRLDRLSAGRSLVHVVVSPPQAWGKAAAETLEGFTVMRELAEGAIYATADPMPRVNGRPSARAAHAAGRGVGGVLIYHPWRVPSKKWNDRTFCAEGPHFHFVGDAFIHPDETKKLYYATVDPACEQGWVVENLSTRARGGFVKSVFSTLLYCLSHAGRAKRALEGNPALAQSTPDARPYLTDASVWFGRMSYNVVPEPEREREAEGIFCAICAEKIPRSLWFELLPKGPPLKIEVGAFLKLSPSEVVAVRPAFGGRGGEGDY